MGNTHETYNNIKHIAVHPHGRGEHLTDTAFFCQRHGSSPRSWGTLAGQWWPRGHGRFIPTVVGNTRRAVVATRSRPVHPHGRGEHLNLLAGVSLEQGSSPRSWGTLGKIPRPPARPRFIPTVVGNTSSAAASSVLTSVHPHGRGEHALGNNPAFAVGGSSPRSWGTLGEWQLDITVTRFIPTVVGNTL